MPEGVLPYAPWDGRLSPRSRIPLIAWNEILGASRSFWTAAAILAGLAVGATSIIEFYNMRGAGVSTHGWEGYLVMHTQVMWFALGLAAVMGGTALLEDSRLGALDLYMARSVTTWEYLAGKVGALVALTTLLVFLPALFFWASSYVFYEGRPDGWAYALGPSLAVSLMWGIMVSGLALGLSSLARSASAAALLLFGGFATLAYLVDPPGLLQRVATITALTEDMRWAVLSPFAAIEVQYSWLYPGQPEAAFPFWWGLLVWAGLTIAGWGLLVLRRPRLHGGESGKGGS